MSKTVEEAWQEFADGAERRWPERDRRVFAAGYVAGATCGAEVERKAILAIINEELAPIGLVGAIVNYPILETRIRQRGEK